MSRSAYLTLEPRNAVLSVVAAVVVVVVVGVVTKALVEGLTSFTYTIHWFETVPVLVLLVAFAVNGWLNERDRRDQETD